MAAAALEAPLAAFHSRKPVRTWSLIVSFLGDAVLPRGGVAPAGAIAAFCALAGIDGGSARTALSRLVARGFLERERMGRRSLYSLTETERATFAPASELIYGTRLPEPTGRFEIAFAPASGAGWAVLAPGVLIRPGYKSDASGRSGILLDAAAGPDVESLTQRVWPIAALGEGYLAFIDAFSGLERAGALSDADAILARVLLVHEFRRVLLKDPFLPEDALPADWPGEAARRLFAGLHGRLSPGAGRWLDAQGVGSQQSTA